MATNILPAYTPPGGSMLTGAVAYPNTFPNNVSAMPLGAIELNDVVVRRVANGWTITVYDGYNKVRQYVCGENDDVGDVLKVSMVKAALAKAIQE